jgi:hypothetical protein
MDIFERALPALEYLKKEGTIPESEFLARVRGLQPDEEPRFASFLELDPGDPNRMVTISPLLDLFWELDHRGGDDVFVSPEIARRLQDEAPAQVATMQWFLAHLAHPLWRGSHFHTFHGGTDLSVFKPGNVAARAAGILKDQRFYVCELYTAHNLDYEGKLKDCRSKDYDLSKFVAWTGPASAQGAVEAANEALQAVSDGKVEDVITEKQELHEKLRKAKAQIAGLNQAAEAKGQELKLARSEVKTLRAQVEGLSKELRLRDALK